jgi:small subunit ribosomal protein S21
MKDNQNKINGRCVNVRENENINQALKRFKKKVEDSGVLEVLRQKEQYETPSMERKRARAAAKARWQKKVRESLLPPKYF